MPDGIQEGFTEEVNFRKLSKFQNVEGQTDTSGERLGKRKAWPRLQGPFQHLLTP